jgi:predicted MFS family arabinose efflux permease
MTKLARLYQRAYAGLTPSIWWLSLVMLVNRAGTMVVPFMTLYLTEVMHYKIGEAGLIVAIYGCGAIVGAFIGGKLTDKFGFHDIQFGSLLCGGILLVVLGQMRSFPTIAGCAFVLALTNESFRPANSAAIAAYGTTDTRTRSYSLNRLAANLGWAAGGALGGFVASHDYHLLFWIDGITNISAALLLKMVLSPGRNSETPARPPKLESTRSAYKDRPYLVFTFLTILFAFCFFQLFSIVPLFYRTALGFSPFFIGFTMSLNGILIVVLEMLIVFHREGKRNNLHHIALGTLLTGGSFVVLNLLPGTMWMALLATLLITFGEMYAFPFMNAYWVGRTDGGNRGQYAGLFAIAWSIAQVLGPGTGSQIAQRYGFTLLWWLLAAICLTTTIGYRWMAARAEG